MRNLYSGLWTYARGQRPTLIAAYLLLATAECVRLAVPWFSARAINIIQQQGTAGLTAAGINLAWVFVSIAVGWGLHAPGRILERNVALHLRKQFSIDLLQRLMRAPLSWHTQQHSAQLAHRVAQSSDALHAFAETQYVYVQNFISLVGPLIALYVISPWVGLVALLGFGLLGAFSLRLDRVLIRLSERRNDADRHYHATWMDTLSNVLTVYALRRFDGARRLIMARLEALYVPLRQILVLNEAKWATVDVISALLWCSLLAQYAWLASHHAAGIAAGLALGSVFMVYEYARRAEAVMTVIAGDFSIMAGYQANFSSAVLILEAPQHALPTELNSSTWQQLHLRKVVPEREVSQRRDALTAELRLQRGKRYALVGRSGAGKSTLLRILSGLEVLRSGHIEFDGKPAVATRLREEATLVPQEAQLFVGSIEENLTLGADLEQQRIEQAIHAACADEFLKTLPAALHSMVTEDGSNWSGGQRQRIALARGLLAAQHSSLVLLDEPTAGLDSATEFNAMQRALQVFSGCCVVVALHHLPLLELFDEVILMEDGEVVEVMPVTAWRTRHQLLDAICAESAPTARACAPLAS